jgi:hypothetical protein
VKDEKKSYVRNRKKRFVPPPPLLDNFSNMDFKGYMFSNTKN